eukprot:6088422-Prymnesium_polylepis.2
MSDRSSRSWGCGRDSRRQRQLLFLGGSSSPGLAGAVVTGRTEWQPGAPSPMTARYSLSP